jgi:hypothetical protein
MHNDAVQEARTAQDMTQASRPTAVAVDAVRRGWQQRRCCCVDLAP